MTRCTRSSAWLPCSNRSVCRSRQPNPTSICRLPWLPPSASASRLIESSALMKHADLFVGPNSGPMNIAVAVGTPAFGFFATNKVLTYSRHIHAILPDDGRLAPDGMQRLSPHRVVERIGSYLDS